MLWFQSFLFGYKRRVKENNIKIQGGDWGTKTEKRNWLRRNFRVVGGEIDKMISQDKMVRHIYNDYYVIGTILDISYHNSLGQ